MQDISGQGLRAITIYANYFYWVWRQTKERIPSWIPHPDSYIEQMVDKSPSQVLLHDISNRPFFIKSGLPLIPVCFIIIVFAKNAQRKNENLEIILRIPHNKIPRSQMRLIIRMVSSQILCQDSLRACIATSVKGNLLTYYKMVLGMSTYSSLTDVVCEVELGIVRHANSWGVWSPYICMYPLGCRTLQLRSRRDLRCNHENTLHFGNRSMCPISLTCFFVVVGLGD
jgi:hypothetical protein